MIAALVHISAVGVLIIVVVWAALIFCWSLASTAADADRRIARMEHEPPEGSPAAGNSSPMPVAAPLTPYERPVRIFRCRRRQHP